MVFNPSDIDTDDDGWSDYYEITHAKNPLDSSDGTDVDWAARIDETADAASRKLVYDNLPLFSFDGSSEFKAEVDVKLDELPTTELVLMERKAQRLEYNKFFDIRINQIGRVTFKLGNVEIFTDNYAITAERWHRIVARAIGTTLTLDVTALATDELPAQTNRVQGVRSTDIVSSMREHPFIINGSSDTDVWIDNIIITSGGNVVLNSDFNDLGRTVENKRGAVIRWIGRNHIDINTSGKFGVELDTTIATTKHKNDTAYTHQWFVVRDAIDLSGDSDGDYIADAWEMEYFDNLTGQDVHRIALEIAMVGVTGIDPKKKYSIKSVPEKEFGGYEFLAYYYVSWARAIPHMLNKLGLPFSKAYEAALQMYNAKYKK